MGAMSSKSSAIRKAPHRVVFFVLIPFVSWGLLRDIANTVHGGSIDLRNRVTGARVAAAGMNPYTYKWMRGDPEEFCDLFNEPGSLLSKTTVTPWALAWHTPFNAINYRTTQWLWLIFQYAALALGLFLWCKTVAPKTAWLGLTLAAAFCLTPSWRHHVDHGQIYVLYVALFFLLYWLHQKTSSRPGAVAEGTIAAFVIGCRPTFPGVGGPLLLKNQKWKLAGALSGLILAAAIPMLLFSSGIWTGYRTAMEVHSELYLHQLRTEPVGVSYPATIEGIPLDVMAGFSRSIPFADSSIHRVFSFQLPAMVLLGFWGLAMAGALGWMIWKKFRGPVLFWAAIAWIAAGDFLIPAFRHNYNDVMVLPMMLFGVAALEGRENARYWSRACFAAVAALWLMWVIPSAMRWLLPMPSFSLFLLSLIAAGWALRTK